MSKRLPKPIRQILAQALDSNGRLLVLVSPDADFQTYAIQTIINEWRRQDGHAYHVHCPQEYPDVGYEPWRVMWRLFFGLTESDSDNQRFAKIEQRILTLCPEFPETMIVLQRLLVPQDAQFQQALLDHWEEEDKAREPIRREAKALDALSPEEAASAEAQQRRDRWFAALDDIPRPGYRTLLRKFGLAVDVLADTTARVVSEAAKETPTLIAFDGVHHMSATSLDLLVSVAQQVTTLPLLLIATHKAVTDPPPYLDYPDVRVLHSLEQATVTTLQISSDYRSYLM